MQHNYFLNMIQNLRQNEEVMLYDNILEISEEDSIEVIDFLKAEYQNETFDYPHKAPCFNKQAAIWAAKTIYCATQLMLYRENKEANLNNLIPDFDKEIGPSEILSGDLCLRFLPNILIQLKLIDSEDKLIQILEDKLLNWHYSGINYPLEINSLDFKNSIISPTLQQLYINRIIENKKIHLARHPAFIKWIDANMGMYAHEFWAEFKLETSNNE